MEIRKALTADYQQIRKIYTDAQAFMEQTGNPDQWGKVHPPEEMTIQDIADGDLYLCVEGEEILGVFYYIEGDDTTYKKIYEGEWLNDRPYAVIHRIAVSSAGRGKGVAGACFDYAFSRCPNIKIDTHENNIPMQKALKKNGFKYCGVIYLLNGDKRIAFQREE